MAASGPPPPPHNNFTKLKPRPIPVELPPGISVALVNTEMNNYFFVHVTPNATRAEVHELIAQQVGQDPEYLRVEYIGHAVDRDAFANLLHLPDELIELEADQSDPIDIRSVYYDGFQMGDMLFVSFT